MKEHVEGLVVEETDDGDGRFYHLHAEAPSFEFFNIDLIPGLELLMRNNCSRYCLYAEKARTFKWEDIHPMIMKFLETAPSMRDAMRDITGS